MIKQKEETQKDKIFRVVGLALEINDRSRKLSAGPWVDVTVKEQGREIKVEVMRNGFATAQNGLESCRGRWRYKLHPEKLNEVEYEKCKKDLETLLQHLIRTKTKKEPTSFYIIRCSDGWLYTLHGEYEDAQKEAQKHIGNKDLTYVII